MIRVCTETHVIALAILSSQRTFQMVLQVRASQVQWVCSSVAFCILQLTIAHTHTICNPPPPFLSKNLFLSSFSSALAGSTFGRFFYDVWKKGKNHETYIYFSLREPGQMCFPQAFGKNSTPEDTFLLALAHITPLCHCAPTAWTDGESLLSPCLIIGSIQSIKNPSAICSWNAAALAGVYIWELDKSWVEITDRCQWWKAGALHFHGKSHQWLFTCLRGWINWWYCRKMDCVK